ncbi:hypothetical protein C8F04DRAFT_1146926 [Mycena alexandri]|uniref:Pheromone receptor n=1 Tax=Mycena alexandri TaxID=1745969 RepID=A0AAD6S299_9AGAR|nr:hypothetical protein C8F04DRAFT_1146926 [Mycena alexandri]
MLVVLPVLSFICAGLLAVFLIILIRRPTVNTSNVSIVLWLLFGNAVHAVNTIVWIPIWCDIVTKLLLGVTIALPGVCLCSARYLELPLLRPQDIPQHLLETIPHALRSINRSTPAVLIMIIPPLILCSISLLLTVWNYARLSSERFHLSPLRSVLIVTLFPLLGPRHRSWAQFRPNYSAILFVREPAEVGAVQTVWWSIPVVSMVYLVLTLVLGDETTDTFSWVQAEVSQRASRVESVDFVSPSQHEMVSKYSSLPVQLRSGWDDMLDVKPQVRRLFATDSDDDSPSSSPTLKDDLEDAFTSSTLSYLASPVARRSGLPSPIASSTLRSLVQSRSQGTSPTVASPMGSSAMPSPSPIAPSPAPVLRVLIPMTPVIPPAPSSAPPPQPQPRQPTLLCIFSFLRASRFPETPPRLSRRSGTHRGRCHRQPDTHTVVTGAFTHTVTHGFALAHAVAHVYLLVLLRGTAASRAPSPTRVRRQTVTQSPASGAKRAPANLSCRCGVWRRKWSREALARGYAATDVIYMTRTGEATVDSSVK